MNLSISPHFSMTPAQGTAKLGQLLSASYRFCIDNWKQILIIAVIAGTITALMQGTVQQKTATQFGSMMQKVGMDVDKMEQLSVRMQAGDQTAAAEMEAMIAAGMGSMDEQQMENYVTNMRMTMLRNFGPQLGLMALLGIVLSVCVSIYFFLLALDGQKDPAAIASRIPKLFFPMLGVWGWSFVCTFIWIPVIGIALAGIAGAPYLAAPLMLVAFVLAIVLGPRYILGPVILIKEKKGITQSVKDSYARTQGYWPKIAGNWIVAVLCMIIASIVIGIVGGLLGIISPLATLWFMQVMNFVLTAFLVTFMVKLSLTIMENPGVVTTKKN
jgi:hypothetical protein